MANVVRRTTCELRESVNTPDYPIADWIINPDLSALSAVAHKYWKVVGETVVEMTQAEKDTVDANEVTAADAAEQAAVFSSKEMTALIDRLAEEFVVSEASLLADLKARVAAL